MQKNIFIFVVLICLSICAFAESYEPGEIMIRFYDHVRSAIYDDFLSSYSQYELVENSVLSPRLNIVLFNFNDSFIKDTDFLAMIRKDQNVYLAQFNHHIEQREYIPDDPRFEEQWALKNTGQSGGTVGSDIKATFAWEIIENAPNKNTREKVIAIVDDGFALAHTDLNLWKNLGETPGNGIDDDGNGYIDDYDGWRVRRVGTQIVQDGIITSANHGTHVSGIAAAAGNNGIGVSGVNLDMKIMCVIGSSGVEAVVVAAYDYVLTQRTIYNETGGESGAYVVATNSSFGVDYGNPTNYPIWENMYTLMGEAGILSAAATANRNIDVDIMGDVPTAMTTPYLISVTNTTRADTKSTAAWGLESIDLGAPGTSILSTVPTNGFSNMSGTSMSTPHVAGAIGLMYTVATEEFLQQFDPGELALLMRYLLLDAVDPIAALQNITVTGGRLNVQNAVQNVIDFMAEFAPRVTTPIILPESGNYLSEILVSITCDTPNAVLYYTLDESDPDEEAILYEEPFPIFEDITIKAIGYAEDYTPSQIAIANYTFLQPITEPPIIEPENGLYIEELYVSITSETPDAMIYYTIDETDPNEDAILYEEPFTISDSTIIRAIAIAENHLPSEIIEREYYIFYPIPPREFSGIDNENIAELSWTTPMDDFMIGEYEIVLTGYNVYRSGLIDSLLNENPIQDFTFIEENLENGIYVYHVTAIYFEEYESLPSSISITIDFEVSEVDPSLPTFTNHLYQNYPNPFNPSTTIQFSLKQESNLRVDLYNIKGQKVITLIDRNMPAGEHKVVWDGIDEHNKMVSSGLYFYKMEAQEYTAIRKMILMK